MGLRDSLYLRYYVKFHPGWEFVLGGKLPGLASAGAQSITGGIQANGTNGWSTRYMWRANNSLVVYGYLDGKHKKAYGYDFVFYENPGVKTFVDVNKWHCLEQYIELNQIGQTNGKIRAWFNGDLSVDVSDALFRTVNNRDTKIGSMYFSTFYGGNSQSWAPTKDTYASFDNFAISDKRIGCLAE